GAGNYDVSLISTNSFGSDTATQSGYISVAQTPVPDFSISDQSLCAGDCVSFTDLSTGTVQTYTWTFAGGFPLNSNQQSPSFICYLTPGDFSVTLTEENGTCANSITRVSYVNVNQAPTPFVTLAGDTLISTPALTYQWYEITTGAIPAGIFQNYVATQTGDYYVCIHDAFGCSACSDTIHVDLSSVPEINIAAVSIYPNPVENELTVRANTTITEISILDVCGKQIITAEPKTNTAIKTIDTNLLASGIYWIEVSTSGKLFRHKFVKVTGR
ncbi:MAG: T9SS type A sorting domain-containing protein, partial [Bacteroidota bacterium]